MAWTDEDVERWLNDWPLPKDFVWRGEVVYPRYQLKHGYGQWLRTAGSYHPALRGLFRLCCSVIQALPTGAPMPSPEALAALLRPHEPKEQAGLELDAEAPEIGRGVAKAAAERDGLTQPLGEAWPTT